MTTHLDVLLLESLPGTADAAAAALEDAGHRVHRCFDHAGPETSPFACAAMTEPGGCPLDASVDVALVARDHAASTPGPRERAVACAVRAGVPIVAQGSDPVDELAPWIDRRVNGEGVVAACEAAADAAWSPLRAAILERIGLALRAAAIEPEEVDCRLAVHDGDLGVHLHLPRPADARTEHVVAVRTLDAVRSGPRSFDQVRVFVHGPTRHPASV
jgi:hypothetical protein